MKVLQMLLTRLPPRLATPASRILSLAAGVLAAIILHYVLYRIDLPSKPFIYVAF
ncbi:MAG: hypothetical protein PHE83_02450 [Opitutaceae bacterium]|nr:hypothetical protein [Opitutaceae bacterium]